MKLDIVQDGIYKSLDVWVLVAQEFQYDWNHLNLSQNDISSRREEKELKEGV